jgi:hypothetical protein
VYRVLAGNLQGKRTLWRSRCRWEDNVNLDLQEFGYWGMDWIELAQDRGMWRVPSGSIKCREFLD